MIRVFISQPFSGKTEEEVMKQRDEIVEKLKSTIHEDIYVIDQYHQEPPAPETRCNKERVFYLGNSIALMSMADLIVFSKDYENALGCKAEMYIAQMYSFDIMMEESM